MKARETYLSIAHIDELIDDITPIEAEYINAFKDERRKKESTLARIELQNLCMQRYGKTLPELNFQKNKMGKPIIDQGFCGISHSEGFVFTSLSEVEIGIDIERIEQENIDALQVAFAEEEWAKIADNPYLILTNFSIKEAIAKKRGLGFLKDPKSIKLAEGEYITNFIIQEKPNRHFVLTICHEENFHFSFVKRNKICKFVTRYEG